MEDLIKLKIKQLNLKGFQENILKDYIQIKIFQKKIVQKKNRLALSLNDNKFIF